MSDVLHHGARQADRAGAQRRFSDPRLPRFLDHLFGALADVGVSHSDISSSHPCCSRLNVLCTGTIDISTLGQEACQLGALEKGSGRRPYPPTVFELRERRRRSAPTVDDIVPALAREVLAGLEPGARLPTVRELAVRHRSSNSSVHSAIGRLEEAGAVRLETRGRAGAFLLERSVDRLWAMMNTGPLVIALPLASSPRYEALATAIKRLITGAGVDVILMFVRGSRQRLQAVREGRCHLAA
ncbi:MAG: GntR family transcriptional regulator, partial [Chloroflexi bacterium]